MIDFSRATNNQETLTSCKVRDSRALSRERWELEIKTVCFLFPNPLPEMKFFVDGLRVGPVHGEGVPT